MVPPRALDHADLAARAAREAHAARGAPAEHRAEPPDARRSGSLPPPGYQAAELANGGEENGGEFGYAKVEIKDDPDSPRGVLVKRTVVFDMSTIPVDKYDAWRAWLQRVDALLHRSVRFSPAAQNPPHGRGKNGGHAP